jgi:hypothetical protein
MTLLPSLDQQQTVLTTSAKPMLHLTCTLNVLVSDTLGASRNNLSAMLR